MVLSAKLKSAGVGGGDGHGGWGMSGFLLIFFPDDSSSSTTTSTTTRINCKKKTLPSYPSPSPSPSSPSFDHDSAAGSSARTRCAAAPLISRTQSTLSICALLLFSTFIIFTFSTFEPTSLPHQHNHHFSSRRQLFLRRVTREEESNPIPPPFPVPALQGMGKLYRRGTKSMGELIVAHVSDEVEERELRSFLRALHLTGLMSRSDLALLFSSSSSPSALSRVVEEENGSFLKLVRLYAESGNRSTTYLRQRAAGEGAQVQVGTEKKDKETIWGKGTRPLPWPATTTTTTTTWGNTSESGEVSRASYGSVVGFTDTELDPENSLSGFMDHVVVPLSLRRWACYPMLLGRVKRNFKHVMLVDVKEMLVFGDPFARIRNRSSESVVLWSSPEMESGGGRRGRRSAATGAAAKTASRDQKPGSGLISPGIVAGGGRGMRRFAAAGLTEIVRLGMEHRGKGRNPVSESAVVSHVARSSYMLKSVGVVAAPMTTVPTGVMGSMVMRGFGLDSVVMGPGDSGVAAVVVQRGHGNLDADLMLMGEMCSSRVYSSVYSDCVAGH